MVSVSSLPAEDQETDMSAAGNLTALLSHSRTKTDYSDATLQKDK